MTYVHEVPQHLQTRTPVADPPAPATSPPAASPPAPLRPGSPGTGASALAAELRVALMRSVRRIRAERAEDALPDSQYSVLALLERMEPTTPGALADAEHVQPPSMTRTIAALVEAGVVERRAHPQDRRQVLVETTQAGRELLQATRRRRDQWLTKRLAQLSPHERAVLAEAAAILRRVVAP